MPRLNVVITGNTATTVTVVMWADVPLSRQTNYSNPNAVSAWVNATPQDVANLKSGAVVEQVTTQAVGPSTTLAQLESQLQAGWQNYQNAINSANPWQLLVGTTWDGTSWTVNTVAI